jgi:hypothetical protein
MVFRAVIHFRPLSTPRGRPDSAATAKQNRFTDEEIRPMQMKHSLTLLILSCALALSGGYALAESESGPEDAVTQADEAAEAEAKAAEAVAEEQVEKAEEAAEEAAEEQAREISGD